MTGITGRWRVRLLAGCLLAGIMAAPVAATEGEGTQTRGVAVDLAQIDIDQPVTANGSRHSLPTLRVRNPGDVPSGYEMVVQPVATAGTAPPAEWFTFSPAHFLLEPGERQQVLITLTVPKDATAGDYQALVSAQLVNEDPGARVGAAAASHLRFTVASEPSQFGNTQLWWVLSAVALALAWLGLRWVVRRYHISIRRRI